MANHNLPYVIPVGCLCEHLNHLKTRLHSSRMHTARALTVSPSMLCAEGGVLSPRGGSLVPGVYALGVSAPGGCLLQGGLLRGVSDLGGV